MTAYDLFKCGIINECSRIVIYDDCANILDTGKWGDSSYLKKEINYFTWSNDNSVYIAIAFSGGSEMLLKDYLKNVRPWEEVAVYGVDHKPADIRANLYKKVLNDYYDHEEMIWSVIIDNMS